ncbi:Arm DNA-binding domain-containing protein [Algibacter lectus]|uniref:Arm DNA-binding domain-containing protein n=1 Tax=Algibacter lectus TaxID=221126 RepID=UPI0005AB6F6A|nr:Arm DNA-binding domain-containing protein [Algibacter lectus]
MLFFTKKSRSNPNELSIYVRITVKGKRAEISLKRCVNSTQWDSTKNKGRENTDKIRVVISEDINNLLKRFEQKRSKAIGNC